MVYDAPISSLAAFPAYNAPGQNWWIAYFISGVVVPLIIEKGWRFIKKKYLYLSGECPK